VKLYQIGDEFFPEHSVRSIRVTDKGVFIHIVGEDSPRNAGVLPRVRETLPNIHQHLEVVEVRRRPGLPVEYRPIRAWDTTYVLESTGAKWCGATPLLMDGETLEDSAMWGILNRQTGTVTRGGMFNSVDDFMEHVRRQFRPKAVVAKETEAT